MGRWWGLCRGGMHWEMDRGIGTRVGRIDGWRSSGTFWFVLVVREFWRWGNGVHAFACVPSNGEWALWECWSATGFFVRGRELLHTVDSA